MALQNRVDLVRAVPAGSRGICCGKKWPGGPTLAPWKSHILPPLTPTTPGALLGTVQLSEGQQKYFLGCLGGSDS